MGASLWTGKSGTTPRKGTLAAELCDRGYGRAEGRREAEGCPDPAGAGGARGRALATELLPGRLKDEFYRNRT